MKKSLLAISFAIISLTSFANSKYTLNENTVDDMFAQAEDVTLQMGTELESMEGVNLLEVNNANGEQNVGGYLIRNFFCGFIALHRSYMGTGGTSLWWMYFCIPVVGGLVNTVDFWYVVFTGSEGMEEYRDNSKFIVWIE